MRGRAFFLLCRTGSSSILGWVCGFSQHGETFLEAWAMQVSTQCKSRAMPLGIQRQSVVTQLGLWSCSGASSPVDCIRFNLKASEPFLRSWSAVGAKDQACHLLVFPLWSKDQASLECFCKFWLTSCLCLEVWRLCICLVP